MCRALAAPADHVGLPLHPPSSTAPKPSPSGEGGTAIAVTDEGCSVNMPTSGEKFSVAAPLSQKSEIFASSPKGRAKLRRYRF